MEYDLEDVVEAVMDSKDREYILRILNIECHSCYGRFPMKKVSVGLYTS